MGNLVATTTGENVSLVWMLGWTKDPELSPVRYVDASVPGAVQLDWGKAEGWPSHWIGEEFKRYKWMEDVWWVYRTTLPDLKLDAAECATLEIEGVDYSWSVWVDDSIMHRCEGMQQRASIELPAEVFNGQTELRIIVDPAPKSSPEPDCRSQANLSCKPAVSYGWDFHPRLIPLGIWRPVQLTVGPAARLLHVEPRYELDPALMSAAIQVDIVASDEAQGHEYRWLLKDPQGALCLEVSGRLGEEAQGATLDNPSLWWPNGYGEQPLYTLTLELLDDHKRSIDSRVFQIGFRTIRLVPHEKTWDEPSVFPKGPSTPPITLEVNGQPIFAKGTNMVSPDIFAGTVDRERWRPLLDMAQGVHFNLLRLWGGAPVPGKEFFDLCDERGLLVWVEFPLACNDYSDDHNYLRVLDAESRAIIMRLRAHTSVALWCGGNELFNSWSGMTPQSHAIRLLDRNCFELDRSRPFLPTSPVFGMGHGHYTFYDIEADEEVWQIFQRSSCTAYTEFGIPGPSSEAVLKSFMPSDQLFPPEPDTAWGSHHAFDAWLPESHLLLPVLERYFGPMNSLSALVEHGQWIQAEGLRGLFEESRRQKPVSSMALNWCFNEPWPCAANNSLLAWPAEAKRALVTVGKACRPTVVSAKISKFQWHGGELFAAEIWLLHDGMTAIPSGTIRASICCNGNAYEVLSWSHEGTAPMCNLCGPVLKWQLPPWETDRFELHLDSEQEPEWSSCYELSYRLRQKEEKNKRPINVMNL